MRGNGLLALTEQGLHFRMLYPRRYIFIPLGAVIEVSNPRSFLGKWGGRRLLRVDFAKRDGEVESCAFLVRSPLWWVEALQATISGREPPPAS